jgi:nanoRNase/pAp phosphatase (c-di-AMP/oligoRNAs hydrolase)
MVTRLVLGCGAVGFDLLEAMPRREGLTVVTADHSRAETLREMDVDARAGDPTDTDSYPDAIDVVVVASAHPQKNLRTARRAREFYPDALLVVYVGTDAPEPVVEKLETLADRIIDPVAAVAADVLEASYGPESERTRRLRRVLTTAEEPLAVVSHDNPDPDAIASSLALARIAESLGLDADACYYGEISHQENRALVNLLDLPLVNLSAGDIEGYGSVALVDHSRPGVNDSLPPETPVDVVIDHHPPRGPVEGRFVDLRSDVGATSTLLADYLERFDVEPSEQVATALLYGIQIDTKNFTREVVEADFEAAAWLSEWVDEDVLKRVESPSISADTMEVLGRAIERRSVTDGALSTCVGEIRDRDALAQASDQLLNMESVNTSLVYGFMNGTVYVSGRTRGADIDLGESLREAFGRIGSAGGHADMAGAQIPMGILADVGEGSKETLTEIVRSVIDERFFGVLIDAPSAPTPDAELTLEYDDANEGPSLDRPREAGRSETASEREEQVDDENVEADGSGPVGADSTDSVGATDSTDDEE